VKSTETANSVNTSHLKKASARESAQLDTHSKIQSVFQNASQASETTDSVVVSNSVSSPVAASHTSTNKAHASVNVTLDHIPTPPTESAKPAVQTVSHASHQLTASAADQDSTLRATSVSQEADALVTSSNTTESVLMPAHSEPSESTDTVKEDVIRTLTSWTTSAMLNAQADTSTEPMLPALLNAQLVMFLMDLSVSLFHNHAHQVNSSTPKLVPVLPVNHHAFNAHTLKTIVLPAPLDTHSLPTSVLNQTAVVLESSEVPQDRVPLAHQSVKNVLALTNAQPVPPDTFSTEPTALSRLPT
jgi:hypothetical protein